VGQTHTHTHTHTHTCTFWQLPIHKSFFLNYKKIDNSSSSYLDLWSQCGVAIKCSDALTGFGGSPDRQPVVNGNNDRVLEKHRGHHEEDHEEPARGQVAPAHLRRRRPDGLIIVIRSCDSMWRILFLYMCKNNQGATPLVV